MACAMLGEDKIIEKLKLDTIQQRMFRQAVTGKIRVNNA